MPGFTNGSSLSTTSCEHPKRIRACEGRTSAKAMSEVQYIVIIQMLLTSERKCGRKEMRQSRKTLAFSEHHLLSTITAWL